MIRPFRSNFHHLSLIESQPSSNPRRAFKFSESKEERERERERKRLINFHLLGSFSLFFCPDREIPVSCARYRPSINNTTAEINALSRKDHCRSTLDRVLVRPHVNCLLYMPPYLYISPRLTIIASLSTIYCRCLQS